MESNVNHLDTDRYAGIDLGGTSIKIGLADHSLRSLGTTLIETQSEAGPEKVISRMVEALGELLATHKCANESLKAIGVGAPGLVDLPSGATKFLPNFAGHWRDVPLAEMLRQAFDVTVGVLNDARAATLAELQFGHGRSLQNPTMVFFGIGTGIGGGVVIDGKLRLGPLGAAGEVGHQTIWPDGPRCGCGNRGCLEAIASAPAIASEGRRLMQIGLAPCLEKIVGGTIEKVTPKTMANAADQDEAIGQAIERIASAIGIAVANTITCIHPDLVIIGGGVAQMEDRLIQPVKKTVRERVRMLPSESVDIRTSKLGEHAGLQGALALAKQVGPPSTD